MDKTWSQVNVSNKVTELWFLVTEIAVSMGSPRLGAFLNLKMEAEPTSET
jgi:hypothetical protein